MFSSHPPRANLDLGLDLDEIPNHWLIRIRHKSTWDRGTSKGIFAIGGFYGYGNSGLLNMDGTSSHYAHQDFGLDVDLVLWDSGAGEIRFGVWHVLSSGKAKDDASRKIEAQTTVFGFKFFTGNNFYLGGGFGNGQFSMTSDSDSLKLNYRPLRATLGFEFGLMEGWLVGIEFAYQNAIIKKNENSALSENTYREALSGGIRLIWSPPFVTYTQTTSSPKK